VRGEGGKSKGGGGNAARVDEKHFAHGDRGLIRRRRVSFLDSERDNKKENGTYRKGPD